LIAKARKCNKEIGGALKEFSSLKFPFCTKLSKNLQSDFKEDPEELLKKAYTTDSSLFLIGKTNKRGNFMSFGRLFNDEIFDSFELKLVKYSPMLDFDSDIYEMRNIPSLVFNGSIFDSEDNFALMKEYFIDFFNNKPIEKLNPKLVSVVVSFTAPFKDQLLIRTYCYSHDPESKLCLQEIGPSFDFEVKSVTPPSSEMKKEAFKEPAGFVTKGKNKKNRETDAMGNKFGRVRLLQQDLTRLNKTTFRNTLKK